MTPSLLLDDPVWADVVAEAQRRADAAKDAYRWDCDLEDCDGRPHGRWTYSHARTKQRLPEGAWFIWLMLLGRRWGKTRTGSETFLDLILANPRTVDGKKTNWLIAGPTFADTRDVCVEGPLSRPGSGGGS